MPHPATVPQPLPLPERPGPGRRLRPARRRRPAWRPLPLPDPRSAFPVPRRPRLTPATAVCAEVAHDGSGGEFGASRGRVRRWIESRTGARAPAERGDADTGTSRFDGRCPVGHTADRATAGGRCFAAALDGRGRSARSSGWQVQVFLVENEGITRLHATLLTDAGLGARSTDATAAPDIVHDLADSPGLTDYGWRLRAEPWIVRDRESVEALVDLLEDPQRTRPVFVTGLEVHETDADTAAIDVADLAWRTLGLAHVVVLTGPMTFALSDRLGRRFSVFGNAVRTYRPGCVLDREEAEHPMALAETVREWRGGSREFVHFLAREAAHTSLERQTPEIAAVPATLRRGFLREEAEAAEIGGRGDDDAFGRALRERTPDGDGVHPLGAGFDETVPNEADPEEAEPEDAAEPERAATAPTARAS